MNNNPFEPVLPEPADLTPTDSAADDFTADSEDFGGDQSQNLNTDNARPTRTSIAIDGITPRINAFLDDTNDDPSTNSVADNTNINGDDTFSNNVMADDSTSITNNDNTASGSETKNESSSFQSAEKDKASRDLDSSLKKMSSAKDSKSPKNNGDKPVKKFAISTVTIVLFILTLAGIGGSVYFFLQNNATANELADAQAQVDKLIAEGNDSAASTDNSNSQYDALQNKITDLTSQNNDLSKTVEENKATIDSLTSKNSDLTKTNADLSTKVQNISDLTTRLDSMLNKLESAYGSD